MNHIRAVLAVSGIAIGIFLARQWTEPETCYEITVVNSYTEHGVTHLLPPQVSRTCFANDS